MTELLNNGYANLHPMQFGFRKSHSTETATCYFLENLKSLLDQGGFVATVFLDLKRAFDTINHDLLIAKLTHFNFQQRTENRQSKLVIRYLHILLVLLEYHRAQYWVLSYSACMSITYQMSVEI